MLTAQSGPAHPGPHPQPPPPGAGQIWADAQLERQESPMIFEYFIVYFEILGGDTSAFCYVACAIIAEVQESERNILKHYIIYFESTNK